MSNYLEELNPEQKAAVQCTDGPVMIIAGAGSGKTRVLTYRIAYLMEQGADAFNILSLTFTNKAAREMKGRIGNIMGDEAKNLWMGTFHSVFSKILRMEAGNIGFNNNFTIYDSDDSKSLMKSLIKNEGLDDKIYKVNSVLNRISSAKNNLIHYQEYQNNDHLVSEDKIAGRPRLGQLYEAYCRKCKASDAMDFDDLLYYMYVLLKNHPDVLNKYQNKFKYILVDEFQDTNYAQYVIIRKLAAKHENICVVGDDAQSIYAFRGATIQNILNFEKDYSDLKTFKLEQNYRSTKTIVQAANSVIKNNQYQLDKDIWTQNDNGNQIRLLKALSDNEEGHLVANTIFQDKMNLQMPNKDFAILYRTNAQSRSMEEALRKLNIHYRIYGGISFYKRKEIKDLLAYFRLSINPQDEEAFKRVINYPKREIGKTTMDKLSIAADAKQISIWDICENIHLEPISIAPKTKKRISDFVAMIKNFNIMANKKNAFEVASHIANATGLIRDLYADRTPEGISHYENIQELLNGIKEFIDTGQAALDAPSSETVNNEMRLLGEYMADIALLTDADSKKNDDNDDFVSLMTIHMAKGLEFKQVFVVGLEENLFPSQLSLQTRNELEEERRLFYVALTRAEQQLTITHAATRYRWGNLITSERSRFIDEIDPKYIDDKTPKRAQERPQERPSKNWSGFGRAISTTAPSLPSRFKKLKSSKPKNGQTTANFEGDDLDNMKVGMKVEHQRFGLGEVISIEGLFPDHKATVEFENLDGQKQLLLKYAKLKIIRS
ncbi:MAG: UvrD-helicase domain-containing protein [Bacteroidia bacterium]|nr:UvrD-helicase domain-containing protein [Bacteroidia bacterium]